MRRLIIIAVFAATIIGATAALAAKPIQHQHYASFGPWCVSKHDGVMRAVRGIQPCKTGEVRIGHKRIPLDPIPGPRGPKGTTGAAGEKGDPGPVGANGEAGATGAQGPKGDAGAPGAPGPAGPQGPKGDTGPQGEQGPAGTINAHVYYFCVSQGGSLQQDVNGKPCDNNGHRPIELYGP